MQPIEIVVIIGAVLVVLGVLIGHIHKKKSGKTGCSGCSGCCSSCSSCNLSKDTKKESK